MVFKLSDFNIDSDFPILSLAKEEGSLDLHMDLDDRVVNLYMDGLPAYIKSRLQFTRVSRILIRLDSPPSKLATIHLLRSIDMATPLFNFVLDLDGLELKIKNKEGFVEIHIVQEP